MSRQTRGRSAAPVAGTYAAAIQRYDGSTGAAWFRGAWHFAPGVITTLADFDTCQILVNGSEPAGGIYATLLDGRHSDDSYRSVFVEFQATVNDASPVTCSCVFNTVRSVADIGSPQIATELVNRAWCLAPTLFGITDPSYLCASQVAPLPVVPLTDMPASVQTFLTTELDLWNATNTLSDASYNEQYPLLCRYLSTGSMDDLAEAIQRNASNNGGGELSQQLDWNYGITDAAASYTPDTNPANYAQSGSAVNDTGVMAEPQDAALTNYLVYQCTGWVYSKYHIWRNAICNNGAAAFGDYAETLTLVPDGNNDGYPRQNFRWSYMQGVLAHILRLDTELDFASYLQFKIGADTYGTASRSMAARVQRRSLRLAAYAATVVGPAWWVDLWGTGEDNVDGTLSPRAPNFQYTTALSLAMAYLNGTDTTSAVYTQMDAIADWVWGQQTVNTITYNGYGIYGMPYEVTDPAGLPSGGSGTYAVGVAALYAWRYARDNTRTTERDRIDYVMKAEHIAYWNGASHQAETKSRKIYGEMFHMAFHAAAWRSGVPWNGWTI